MPTFVGETNDEIRSIARPAMAKYIQVNIAMQKDHSAGTRQETAFSYVREREKETLIRTQVTNDLHSPLSFIGTLEQCGGHAERLSESGVDEIACLIDFGAGFEDVMKSIGRLAMLIAR